MQTSPFLKWLRNVCVLLCILCAGAAALAGAGQLRLPEAVSGIASDPAQWIIGLAVAAALFALLAFASHRELRKFRRVAEENVWLTQGIQGAPEAFAVYAPNDRLVAWSQPFERLYGRAFQRLSERQSIYYPDLLRESAPESVESAQLDAHIAERVTLQRNATGQSEEREYPGAGWHLVSKYQTPSKAVGSIAINIASLKHNTAVAARERDRRKELEQRMRSFADTDSQTGTLTQDSFTKRLSAEIERSCRYDNPMSLLAVELKDYANTHAAHGELVAEQILRMAAGELLTVIRAEVDVLGRFGGQNFTVLLPEIDTNGAQRCAERICDAIGSINLRTPEGVHVAVSAMVGVTSLGERELDASAVLAEAQAALVQAADPAQGPIAVHLQALEPSVEAVDGDQSDELVAARDA